MSFSPGMRLGPYELLSFIGSGGMGEVWKAHDTRLDREVAIKSLRAREASRFAQEARAIASLNHPNICQIYDVGQDYLVLEYVEGKPLPAPQPPENAVTAALQIADALELGHRRGVLHRDLKPANILLTTSGALKLLDFGFATTLDRAVDVAQPLAGALAGTPAYVAPEQAQGKPLDQRTDIFSFGAVLYEMLSGRRAFGGESAAEVFDALLRDDPAPCGAPPALEAVVRRCMAKDPAARYQTIAEVKAALREAWPGAEGLRIELLGRFQITRGGAPLAAAPGARLRSLIAYLTLRPDTAISRQLLASLFWPESPEAQARTNLRQLLHHFRSALPELAALTTVDNQSIYWRAEGGCTADVTEFEHAAQANPDSAARLYRGDLLPDVYDDWLDPERERLRRIYDGVLERLIRAAEERGDYAGAIPWAELRLNRDELCEASYQTLMRLNALSGDRAGALRYYQRCAEALRRELDVEPGPATRRMRDRAMEIQPPARAALEPVPAIRAGEASPIFGRETERRRLDDIWRAASSGRPSLVLLTGEPGIGKTRLLEELLDRAASRGACVARSSFYSGERPLPYSAAVEWLRGSALKQHVAELPALQRSQLARVLPELLAADIPAAPERPFSEAAQRRQFFEALARAVLKPGAPVLLAIDDLQWCDVETIEWLQYLLRFDPSARLLITATARTDEGADRLTLLERGERIELRPLSDEDTLKLAAQIGGCELSEQAAESLVERTRGNPLFIVETVRSGWSGGEEVPAKLHAAIMRRMLCLSAEARKLAGVAAVIGRPFGFKLAGAASGLDEDAVAGVLDELWRRRILQEESGGYGFTHGCLRDVAYVSLGPVRRKQLHRRVAEALEAAGSSGADESIADLARHFERAGLPERAVPYYRRAALVLRRRFAEREAVECLQQALSLLESAPQTAERDNVELELLTSLGSALSSTEGYASGAAGKAWARARMLCESSGNTRDYFSVLAGSWCYHVVRAELTIGREVAERHLALAKKTGDPMLIASGTFAVGGSFWHLGRMQDARERLDASKRIVQQSWNKVRAFDLGPDVAVFCRAYRSHVLWLMGEPEQAMEESREIVAYAEALSHPFSLALALSYAAMLHQFRDEPEPARDWAEASAAVCRRYGFPYYLSWNPIIVGWAQARLGEHEAGLDAMLRGIGELRATGAGLRAPYYLTLAAQACGWRGDHAAGLRFLHQAAEQGDRTGEAWVQPEMQRIQGDLLRDSGERAQAEACYRKAGRLARQTGARQWEIRAERSLQAI